MENINKPSTELTKIEYALIHSSWEPKQDDIQAEARKDKNLNQYNEPHKPKLRSTAEIVKYLKIKYFTNLLTN